MLKSLKKYKTDHFIRDVKELKFSKHRASKSWTENIEEFRKFLIEYGVDGFIRSPLINKTMFIGNGEFVNIEYKYLLEHPMWHSKWRRVIKDSFVGNPTAFVLNPNTSGNYVHSAYHLARYIEEMGYDLSDIHSVFEVGGGYGAMAKVVSEFKTVDYYIYDLPVFSLLQRWYLNQVLDSDSTVCSSDFKYIKKRMFNPAPEIMFVSTWALSEIPLEEREQFEPIMEKCKYILIASQCDFDDTDNVKYFRGIMGRFKAHSWKELDIEHLPNNKYFFGVNYYA